MKVGFTGTRKGMSGLQASQLQYVLALFYHADKAVNRKPELHFGRHESVELKADKEAAALASSLGYATEPHYAMRGEELDRNREIIAEVSVLIAAPETDVEEQRSGTWATVRYARKKGIPVVMLSRGDR